MEKISEIRYPNIYVKLSGEDGNAFFIIGRVLAAMRRAKVSKKEISLFLEEVKSGNYDHLLQTVMSWVNTHGENKEAIDN